MKVYNYQKYIKRFDKYPKEINLLSYGLGLGGETGEVQEKIKKLYRDHNGIIDNDFIDAIEKEIGDVLWYVAMICNKLDITLEGAMDANIVKLEKREERNMIQGDGDDREEGD